MSAKPIFTVVLPFGSENDMDMCRSVQELLEPKMSDYHILVFLEDREGVKFEAFYEKDFNEVKFKELKQLVKDSMK